MNPTWASPFTHALWDIWWLIWIALCVYYLSKPDHWIKFVIDFAIVAYLERQVASQPQPLWFCGLMALGIAFTAWTLSLPYTRKSKETTARNAQSPGAKGAAEPASKSPESGSKRE